jgi:6-phosphogluconolactonase
MELVGAPVNELKTLLTESFEEWAREQGARGARGACALSGGGTALIFLPALRSANVDWRNITLFWADERAVPPDDPESNFGLAERMLLSPLGAKAPRAIRMPADASSLEQAALWYDDALAAELDNGPLDLALLGVGEDGHVCSLFPGHKALTQNDLRAVAVEDAPKPPRRRLSLTMRYVLQTKKIWVVAIGSRKLPVLHAAINKTSNTTPLDMLMRQAKDVTVFTDQTIRR